MPAPDLLVLTTVWLALTITTAIVLALDARRPR